MADWKRMFAEQYSLGIRKAFKESSMGRDDGNKSREGEACWGCGNVPELSVERCTVAAFFARIPARLLAANAETAER